MAIYTESHYIIDIFSDYIDMVPDLLEDDVDDVDKKLKSKDELNLNERSSKFSSSLDVV